MLELCDSRYMLGVSHDEPLCHPLVDHPVLMLEHCLQPDVLVVLTKRTQNLQVTTTII